MLKDEADAAMLNRHGRRVLAGQLDSARVGRLQPGDDPQDRALARARWSQQGHELAGGNLERDVVDRLKCPVPLREIAHGDGHGSLLLSACSSRLEPRRPVKHHVPADRFVARPSQVARRPGSISGSWPLCPRAHLPASGSRPCRSARRTRRPPAPGWRHRRPRGESSRCRRECKGRGLGLADMLPETTRTRRIHRASGRWSRSRRRPRPSGSTGASRSRKSATGPPRACRPPALLVTQLAQDRHQLADDERHRDEKVARIMPGRA